MRIALLLVFAVLSASAQTNFAPANPSPASNPPAGPAQVQTNQMLSVKDRIEKVRMEVIQKRRIICGKIVKVLPEGLVVDSGYTNLLRAPLNQSWLIPGTVVASKATDFVEANQPDAVCVGLVFITDLPKARGVKPKPYDYVNLEGFPVGEYTYTSVGTIQRTVREFSNKLEKATLWNFDQTQPQNTPPK
jgi:hypothetical protein